MEFEALSQPAQMRRLRRLAAEAVRAWPLRVHGWHSLGMAENACWRVETSRGRNLLRVHRPGYQDHRTWPGESFWLEALASEFGARVPRPVRARDGSTHVVLEPLTYSGFFKATSNVRITHYAAC